MNRLLVLTAAFVAGFGVAYAWQHQPAEPPLSCAAREDLAATAAAALQVCTTIPGCQVDYRDLMDVRGLIVAAKQCKQGTETRLYARPWPKNWQT